MGSTEGVTPPWKDDPGRKVRCAMGRNNQQRRAEKKRRKERRDAVGRGGSCSWRQSGPALAEEVRMYVLLAGRDAEGGDGEVVTAAVAVLAEVAGDIGRATVSLAAAGAVQSVISAVWEAGWQPSEVARAVRRARSARHEDLVATAMSRADLRREWMPEEWARQLDSLGADRWWGPSGDWLVPWAERIGVDWLDALAVLIETVGALGRLPVIESLLPPPSRWDPLTRSNPVSQADNSVLAKVRALLAKAESTSFEAEAEALTAKAQELMARHSIDDTLARASGATREAPLARRIPVDDPYATAKSYLLRAIAEPNGVRTVWYHDLGMMAVIGFVDDLDAVDAMFTSLLVQATKSMIAKGRRIDHQGRSRTRSYRQSFLMAFASRIHERLEVAAVSARRQAETELTMDLLPVLAGRDDEVDDALAAMFPHLRTVRGPSATDSEGWTAGRAAAELATLGPRQEVLLSAAAG
jgi:hypothetical protein